MQWFIRSPSVSRAASLARLTKRRPSQSTAGTNTGHCAGAGERETAGRIETGLRAELGLVDEARDGVARMFAIPGTAARLGFITPSHARFCAGCDKLRLSCRGILRTCLFAGGGVDLLPSLRAGDLAATRAAFQDAMVRKAALGGREGCEVSTMVGIGG